MGSCFTIFTIVTYVPFLLQHHTVASEIRTDAKKGEEENLFPSRRTANVLVRTCVCRILTQELHVPTRVARVCTVPCRRYVHLHFSCVPYHDVRLGFFQSRWCQDAEKKILQPGSTPSSGCHPSKKSSNQTLTSWGCRVLVLLVIHRRTNKFIMQLRRYQTKNIRIGREFETSGS